MITSSNSPISFFYDQHIDSTEVHYQEPSFFDNNESPLCQIFSRKGHQESNNKNVSSGKKKGSELEINEVIKPPGRTKNHHAAAPRKRSGNKDRHSKICTAQGMRDRRMRLSLPIARKFFHLQDMLGFDKASNTIEWLLSKSRNDIKKLLTNHHLPPISDDYADDGGEDLKQGDPNNEEQARYEVIRNEKEGGSKSGKRMKNYHNAKEARQKARARARERTREKMKAQINKLRYDLNPTNNNLDQPFSAIEFYELQKGAFLEDHAHPIDHIYENLESFDHSISFTQMGSHQMFNMENNDEMIVPHWTDCNYNNNGFNWMLDTWGSSI